MTTYTVRKDRFLNLAGWLASVFAAIGMAIAVVGVVWTVAKTFRA